MSIVRHSLLAGILAAASAVDGIAQSIATLPNAELRLAESFTSITSGSLRELQDGRVVIADVRDRLIFVADPRTGTVRRVAREGSGPREYRLPLRLLAAPADSTYVFDPMNQRYLVIAPDGAPSHSFRMQFPQGGPGAEFASLASPRAIDAQGRIYSEAAGIEIGPGGPRAADSAAIVRYDPRSHRHDTLAYVQLPRAPASSAGGSGARPLVGGANPLQPRDEWVVFPDGRVAVVRAEPYRLDWVSADGVLRRGTPIPFTRIRVTDADKREEQARLARALGGAVMVQMPDAASGSPPRASAGPGLNFPVPGLDDWPETKPPFRSGAGSVFARGNGEVWVRRTEPAGAEGSLYDILDGTGAVTRQVRLARGWTLVSVGEQFLWTTVSDDDDLIFLQRHRY
ncbi:MAG: hypothetical protein KF689_01400 [Gemmatimonadaceae bacterium]|nr:hypothetical protein [Gemmatimonadaceae bacterium]MCW5826585.1 hypothetical protein [Gemmatimonadaceae bacterium]